MGYEISARAYLKRARERLDAGTAEDLFYAAFELRAGIQARMQEYLSAQEAIARHKKEDWQLGKLARSIEDAFHLGDRIAEVAIYDPQAEAVIAVFYYTPVTSELKRNGERLGEILHAMQRCRREEDAWWTETRSFMEEVFRRLESACAGTLLCPLLKERGTNRVVMRIEMFEEPNGHELLGRLQPGFAGKVRVQYLDELPRTQ